MQKQFCGESRTFSTNGLEQLNIHKQKQKQKQKNKNLDPDLTPYTKLNSKWITDLNVKCKTMKILRKKIGENLWDLELDKEFLKFTPNHNE